MSSSSSSSTSSSTSSSGSITERKYPRRAFEKRLGVLCAGDYFTVESVDLGEGGVSFISDRAMSLGEHSLISFQIPSGEFVFVRAAVNTIHPNKALKNNRYGVIFEGLSFPRRRQIRLFVSGRV